MGAEITTETLPESDYDEWERLLSESPDGSVYSLPRYLEGLTGVATRGTRSEGGCSTPTDVATTGTAPWPMA